MKGFFVKLLCGFVLISCFFTPCFGDDITDDYYDIAINYYKNGETKKAIEYIDQILKIDENNTKAIGFKIKLNPPTISKQLPVLNPFLIFEEPYVNTGNFKSDSFYSEGRKNFLSKDYMLAEENLKNSIENDPQNFRAYNSLGLVYMLQNKTEDAKISFEKSNSINKNFTLPLDNLAQLYMKQGEYEKMYITLLKAKSYNPEDYYASLLLGDYYNNRGFYSEALKYYREVININPKYKLAYLKIAQVKTDSTDYEGSNATLRYYYSLFPDDYAYYLIAKNYEYLCDWNKAKENIYKAINKCNCKEYRTELGKINYQNDEIQDALDAFISSSTQSTTGEIYNYIGMCYYNMHDFNKAITYINKAIASSDIRVLYYYNLAQIYYTLKDTINYSKYMSFVNNFKPSTCQDYIDLGGIILDSDSKESAISIINKGIEKFPNSKQLYLEKMKVYEITNDNQGLEQTKQEMEKKFN